MESMQRWFSKERFTIEKKYFTRDTEFDNLNKFIDNVMNGKQANFYDAALLQKEYKNAQTVVGQDISKFLEANIG